MDEIIIPTSKRFKNYTKILRLKKYVVSQAALQQQGYSRTKFKIFTRTLDLH